MPITQNTQAIFTIPSTGGRTRLTTANTARDLSSLTNADLLYTAPANGARIDGVVWTHVAGNSTQASIACVGRLYICSDAAGSNPRLRREIDLAVVTPSVSAKGQAQEMTFSPAIQLAAGEALWVAISATQTSGGYDVFAQKGEY